MNIYTLRDNLAKTIAGKTTLLEAYKESLIQLVAEQRPFVTQLAVSTQIEIVELNLAELNAILADVEVCCQQAVEASWALNPEQMGR